MIDRWSDAHKYIYIYTNKVPPDPHVAQTPRSVCVYIHTCLNIQKYHQPSGRQVV